MKKSDFGQKSRSRAKNVPKSKISIIFRDFKDFLDFVVCPKTLAIRVTVGVTGHTVAQNTGLAYPKNSSETDFRFTFLKHSKNLTKKSDFRQKPRSEAKNDPKSKMSMIFRDFEDFFWISWSVQKP